MNYRNIVTVFSFIVVFCILFLIWNNQNIQTESKYQIITSDGQTLLLDKQEGLIWRNVWCDNDDKIPNCWQKMEFAGGMWDKPKAEWVLFVKKTISDYELKKMTAKTKEEKQNIENDIKMYKKLLKN